MSGPFKSCNASVVSGTNKMLIPNPRMINGKKKSFVPEFNVELDNIQVKMKNMMNPPADMISDLGTNKMLIPNPRMINGKKKSFVPEFNVELDNIQVKMKNMMNPPADMICAGTPRLSIMPTKGIMQIVAKPPGNNRNPVCCAEKPRRF